MSFDNARTWLKSRSKRTKWKYCWRTIPASLIVVLLVCSSINERSHKNAWMTFRAWRGKFKLTCSVARTRNSCHEQVLLFGDSTSRKKSIYRSWENYKFKNVGKILKFEIMRNTQRDWARMEIVNTDFER